MVISHRTKHHIIVLSLVLAFVVIMSTEARGDLYDNFGIVENNSGIAGSIASQLSLNVTDPGTPVDIGGVLHNQVLFTFNNAGPLASSITDIYFEDGTLLLLADIYDIDYDASLYTGLDFGQTASPSSLPGGATLDPAFSATAALSVDSESPIKANGVNPGESLGLLYTLQSGKDFNSVITALNLGFTNPDPTAPRNSLRIGLHVQGTGENENYSDSFILTPVPGAFLLGMLGLGVAGVKLRKFA